MPPRNGRTTAVFGMRNRGTHGSNARLPLRWTNDRHRSPVSRAEAAGPNYLRITCASCRVAARAYRAAVRIRTRPIGGGRRRGIFVRTHLWRLRFQFRAIIAPIRQNWDSTRDDKSMKAANFTTGRDNSRRWRFKESWNRREKKIVTESFEGEFRFGKLGKWNYHYYCCCYYKLVSEIIIIIITVVSIIRLAIKLVRGSFSK